MNGARWSIRGSTAPWIVTATAIAMLVSGCVNNRVVTPLDLDAAVGSRPASATLTNTFDYVRGPIDLHNHDAESDDRYELKLLTFPSYGKNGQDGNLVTARYYHSKTEGRRPLVIILPIWGSKHVYPANKMAKFLRSRCQGDAHVLMHLGPNRLVDFMEMAAADDVETFRATTERMAKQFWTAVVDVRRLLDWAVAQPDVDPGRIAIVGFSVGAIVAADVVLADPRVSATALVMGAARPAEIIAYAEGRTERARDIILEKFDWSVERYKAEVENFFDYVDPANQAGSVDPARVLFIDAERDERMPQTARDALWEIMGRPERITLRYDHGYAFLSMTPVGKNYTCKRVWEFLEDNL